MTNLLNLQVQLGLSVSTFAQREAYRNSVIDAILAPVVEVPAVVVAVECFTSAKQVAYFKFLCHKYCISVHIPKTSRESRIKITAILKGVKAGRVKERVVSHKSYTGRDAECLVGAINYCI